MVYVYIVLILASMLASASSFITAIDRSQVPERFFVLAILFALLALLIAVWRVGSLLEERFKRR